MSAGSPTPDFGKIQWPGWLGRWRRRPPRIVREANFAAALTTLPAGATVERIDPSGRWIAFRSVDGEKMLRFRAAEAWLAAEPTIMPNDSADTQAAIHSDGTIVVYEGLHRTRATARDSVFIEGVVGVVSRAPGWLDFEHVEERPPATPSGRAIMELFGGDPDAPPVPAR